MGLYIISLLFWGFVLTLLSLPSDFITFVLFLLLFIFFSFYFLIFVLGLSRRTQSQAPILYSIPVAVLLTPRNFHYLNFEILFIFFFYQIFVIDSFKKNFVIDFFFHFWNKFIIFNNFILEKYCKEPIL